MDIYIYIYNYLYSTIWYRQDRPVIWLMLGAVDGEMNHTSWDMGAMISYGLFNGYVSSYQ